MWQSNLPAKQTRATEVIPMADTEVFGFDELQKTFNRIEKKYPDKVDATLASLGRLATNKTKSKTPVGKTKKLKSSWRMKKPKAYGKTRVVRVQSEAPHAHLVEDGHEIVSGGSTRKNGRKLNTLQRRVRGIKSGGRVEGKKMLEQTFKSMDASFTKSCRDLLADLTKEVEL